MTAVSLQGVSVGYDRRAVLSALDLDIARGSLVAVVGPNGAGKTTLLRAIAGELRPRAGRVVRAAALAWLPQLAAVDRSFPIDVQTFVAMGLWSRIGAFGRLDRDDRARVERALDVVGLGALGRQPIGALSGGQMQRVLFARLWLQDAALILMDEPFTAIDATTEADLLALIEAWHADGRTQLAVLHELRLVRRHFPRTLLLSGDLVIYGPTAEVLATQQLERAGMARDLDNALAADGAPA
jgi:zinc/manganese transport system ATP-binding protein